MVAEIFLIMCVPWVISNDTKAIYRLDIPQRYSTFSPSIFSQNRTDIYFNNHMISSEYHSAMDLLAAQKPEKIGFYAPRRLTQYPIWPLLRDRLGDTFRVEYVGVTNPSAGLRDNTGVPQFVFFTPSFVKPERPLHLRRLEGIPYYTFHYYNQVAVLRRLWTGRGFKRMTSAELELLVRSDLDVYLDRKHNALVYVRDGCSPSLPDRVPNWPPDESFFFLHIFPVDGAALPSFGGKPEDFLGLEFTADSEFEVLLDERCIAVRFPLPPFDIARIRTGESTDAGFLWKPR